MQARQRVLIHGAAGGTALLGLLQQQRIRPLIAHRFPLGDVTQAQELLGKGGVVGKIVLVGGGVIA